MHQPRILLLSAYDASSHRYWRELLVNQLTDFDWTEVTLPDRHFYWRMRSNALTYAFQHREVLTEKYDLILATSMVDLCGLRGLLPSISSTPTLLYFHENQFAYPLKKPSSNIINTQLVSLFSALVADHVMFNSNYNRQSFLSGATSLIKGMPDGVPVDVMETVDEKCSVLPVPITTGASRPIHSSKSATHEKRLQIIWNHRWEYDKQPEVFFDAMTLLLTHGVEYDLHVVGQSFREIPECFTKAKETLRDQIKTWGYQPRDKYLELLSQSDIVVSSASHDFQGLGMLEAISLGCIPIAPSRVAYVEYVPESLRYQCEVGDAAEPQLLCDKIVSLLQGDWPEAPDVSGYAASKLIDEYRELITRTIKAKVFSA